MQIGLSGGYDMIYDLLAPFYDAINADIDYKKWADFIEEIIRKECKSRPELVLEVHIFLHLIFL